MKRIPLNDGNQIPAVGFGIFMIENGVPPMTRRWPR